jgi:hypothetical protein
MPRRFPRRDHRRAVGVLHVDPIHRELIDRRDLPGRKERARLPETRFGGLPASLLPHPFPNVCATAISEPPVRLLARSSPLSSRRITGVPTRRAHRAAGKPCAVNDELNDLVLGRLRLLV